MVYKRHRHKDPLERRIEKGIMGSKPEEPYRLLRTDICYISGDKSAEKVPLSQIESYKRVKIYYDPNKKEVLGSHVHESRLNDLRIYKPVDNEPNTFIYLGEPKEKPPVKKESSDSKEPMSDEEAKRVFGLDPKKGYNR
jgi:hypothetical protein